MNTLAIYGKKMLGDDLLPFLKKMLEKLKQHNVRLVCEHNFATLLSPQISRGTFDACFDEKTLQSIQPDLLLSIGGDGTFLGSVLYVRDSGIPILGLNAGRLGFLTNLSPYDVDGAVEYICKHEYTIEKRTMLQMEGGGAITDAPFALNEITIQKTDRSSLLNIHAYVDGQYLTTYWADGLIIATPTGSTAYSLSGGGPIVCPECDAVILTPLSPHNLSMRSLVLPDDKLISLAVESRSDEYILTMDSRSFRMKSNQQIKISANAFKINVVNLPDHGYFSTLRSKLGWGEDVRNN